MSIISAKITQILKSAFQHIFDLQPSPGHEQTAAMAFEIDTGGDQRAASAEDKSGKDP